MDHISLKDVEFYSTLVLSVFTLVFIYHTYRYYKAGKTRVKKMHRYAKEGDTYAQELLGDEYRKGEFVKKDCKKSLFWYTKAALSGSEKAESFLKTYRRNRNSC